jgi:hypothetical protein
MSGMVLAKAMVVDVLYFNRVQRAPLWNTSSGNTTVEEVKYVLRTGLQLLPIIATNVLPNEYARLEAMQKKAIRVLPLDHKALMEKATKCDRLEYKENNEDKGNEYSKERRSVSWRVSSK